jgi:hypothetical protein
MSNELITLAQDITELEIALAAKKRRLGELLAGGAPMTNGHVSSPSKGKAKPKATKPTATTSDMVRTKLAGGPATYGELRAYVEERGGSNFALKSALGKGRERKEYTFRGGKYSLLEKRTKSTPPPPPPHKADPLIPRR